MTIKKSKKMTHYSRKGCVACKKSHLKCDEKSPNCSRCIKKKLQCTYTTKWFLENNHSNKNTPNRTMFVWKNNAEQKLSASETSETIPSTPTLTNGNTCANKALQPPNTFRIIDEKKYTSVDHIETENTKPLSIIHNYNNTDVNSTITNTTLDNQLDISPHSKFSNNSITFPFQITNNYPNVNLQFINSSTPETHLSARNHSTVAQCSKDQSLKLSHSNSFSSSSSRPHSVSSMRIDDLISVEQTYLTYLNGLNDEKEKGHFLYNETSHPNLNLFDIPWDGGPCVYFIETIEKNDPIVLNTGIKLTDQRMIDFVWTFTRITKFFYTFVMFSETSLISVLDLCFKLGTKSTIFQSIMTYHCSLHVVRIYKQANNPSLANLWDTRVRIPAFKQCIDYLKEGLESSPNFVDIVVLTFAVIIIFSGNACDESWRTHLIGSYQLISKCALLKQTANKNDVFDSAALEIYNIVVEWYKHTSFLASITSLNGFFNRKLQFETSLLPDTNLAIESNNINLMSGHCLELNGLLSKIDDILTSFYKRGIKLTGLNFVHFILNNHNSTDILNQFKLVGIELLDDLKVIKNNYKYRRLPLDDFKMDLSMKYCNLIYIYGIELYITFFFVGTRDKDVIRSFLRDIIDCIYSMPYRSSCAIICLHNIYIASMISLLIEDYGIYDHFLTILSVFELNGMMVPSITVLERLKDILIEKDYEKLLSPENDVAIY